MAGEGKPLALIVDDDSVNLKLLSKLLGGWGYETKVFADSDTAWTALSAGDFRPHVALLDWVMPGTSGVDLCRKIKDLFKEHFVYTILLTGKNRDDEIIEGFRAGADDYIIKPIKAEELKSRVGVGARITASERELEEKNAALEKYSRIMETLAEERARQLLHAERLSLIGELSAGMTHEINNYLSPVIGYTQLAESSLKTGCQGLSEEDRAVLSEYLGLAYEGACRIRALADRVSKSARKSGGAKAPVKLSQTADNAAELCAGIVKRLSLSKEYSPGEKEIMANAQEIEQVFINLIKNASDAMGGASDAAITVKTDSANGKSSAVVQDNGPGIPPEILDKIWGAFYTTKAEGKGTGLGLSISKAIIERHGGSIRVENRTDRSGARFIIEIPFIKS